MNTMQKISSYFIILLMLLLVNFSFADSYEDAANKALQNSDKMTTLSTFKELQKKYRQSATVYFHLGEVSFELVQITHPLFEYGLLSQYLDEMNIYYSNCLHFADKSEVRKYYDFYAIAKKSQEKRATIEEVQGYVKEKLELLKILKNQKDTLYFSFFDMVNQYNQCVTMFYEFCEKYRKSKEAQLLVDQKDMKFLDSLSQKYLDVLSKKDKFRQALKEYPITNYTPKFQIIPIEIYRLDGLNGSDFTQNDIKLWDYQTWIKDFKNEHVATIATLKKDIEKENDSFNKLQSKWEKELKLQTSIEPITINKLLINRLNKVDYESLLIPFFEFRNTSVNIIANNKLSINSLHIQESNILQQALFVADMEQQLIRLTDKKANVQSRLNPVNIEKYQFLFQPHYPTGIDTFLNNEVKKSDSLYYRSIQNLSESVIENDSIYRMSKITPPVECKQNFQPIKDLQLSLLWYDDISQNLLAIYDGNKDTLQRSDTLTLVMTDVAGKEVWKNNLHFQGKLVSLISMDANFLLITNQKNGDVWNIATILLDRSGKYIATTWLENTTSQIALRGIKLNSNVIAVTGLQVNEKNVYPEKNNSRGIFLQINALGDKYVIR